MDAPTRYLPEVAWRTDIKDVELITEATETDPATFKVTIDPIDFNDAGADEPTFDVGFHLTDFEGNIYTAIDKESIEDLEIIANVEYGYFYNRYAVEDPRGLCGSGWHIPTLDEIITLFEYYDEIPVSGLYYTSGNQLKQDGTTYWNVDSASGLSGFNLRGLGERYQYDGAFAGLRSYSNWHLSSSNFGYGDGFYTEASSGYIWRVEIIAETDKQAGWGIRLIKDSTTLTHGQTGSYTGNDGKIYPTICIGSQEYISVNLSETKYTNGDLIAFEGVNSGYFTNAEWAELTIGARCAYNNIEANAITVSSTGTGAVTLRGTFADNFRTEECPKSGFQGIISKSVWKGRGTNLAPIFYRYLDSNALAKVKRLELDMLWSNDPNAVKIPFENTATPSITNYQDDRLDGTNLHYDYGELPKLQLFTLNTEGQYWERQEKPVWNYVDGLIDSIVYDLSDVYTGYIVISK